jgi:tRNA-Thr(GGU) m(6)t(6)A37 methyltransferase TsaA
LDISKPNIIYKPIGVIHSEHLVAEQTPIQPVYAAKCKGSAEVFAEYAAGLSDLQGFSHLFLIYHFHKAGPARLLVKPYLQDTERGVFATRAPCRPNAVGLSVVELVRIEGTTLYLEGMDMLDGTPLLDIKPFISRFDRCEPVRNGWQDEIKESTARQGGRRKYNGAH